DRRETEAGRSAGDQGDAVVELHELPLLEFVVGSSLQSGTFNPCGHGAAGAGKSAVGSVRQIARGSWWRSRPRGNTVCCVYSNNGSLPGANRVGAVTTIALCWRSRVAVTGGYFPAEWRWSWPNRGCCRGSTRCTARRRER